MAAADLLRVGKAHPECAGGEILPDQRIRLDIKVEMPLHLKADGISATGVRTIEPVILTLPPEYPWRSPIVTLRADFPRHFPHLQPGTADELPRPCLIEGGRQDEFFLQWGLVEYGLFHLIEQIAVWLRKAAIDALIDPEQGWEPMWRRDLRDALAFDANTARAEIKKRGGIAIWNATFHRAGQIDGSLRSDVSTWITSDGAHVALRHDIEDRQISVSGNVRERQTGSTIVAIIWPSNLPSGAERIADRYWPEDVATLEDLKARATEFGCDRELEQLLSNLERYFDKFTVPAPMPIGIVFCVRRPSKLIGTNSNIELLPYVIEARPLSDRSSLFAQGSSEPVAPAMHIQTLTTDLLRTISASPSRPSITLLGCGSVGSKLAMHAARAGQEILAVSDEGLLRPHNMARHALGGAYIGRQKAEALAVELRLLGQSPAAYTRDLGADLRVTDLRKQIIPYGTKAVINATASLSVREALVASTKPNENTRYFEAALFGRGRVAYLLSDGAKNNPNHFDLMAELYATLEDAEAASLLFDPDEALEEIQIGQGCGSLTMPVDDAQLSMMTAALSKEVNRALDAPQNDGSIIIGVAEKDSPATRWSRRSVRPFEVVPIAGSDDWQLRISNRVIQKIRAEMQSHTSVETGGLMIGLSSARLKTVTVVDLLNAPADSSRSASLFVLGTQGLQEQISARHEESGQTLFDVGTWHSHLEEQGPSTTDWATAAALAAERVPPSVLLIATPTRFHALIARNGL